MVDYDHSQKESAKEENFDQSAALSQSDTKATYPKFGSTKNVFLKVSDPTVKEDTFTKHVLYKIKGIDNNGDIDINRRYSEFKALRTVLVERWPGCYIPPLPSKKLMGNMDPAFIEERRHFLQLFLELCIEIPHIYYSEEFQVFLRTKSADVSAALTSLPKLSYDEIIEKYSNVYSHLSGVELNNDNVMRITNFQLYLTKVSKMFEQFKKIAKHMVDAKKNYYDTFLNFHQMLLVDYEKNCLIEYSDNKDANFLFSDPSSDKLFIRMTKIKEASLKESYESMNDLIRHEARDIKAFLEAIEQREKYQQTKEKLMEKIKSDTKQVQKLAEGKTTFKGLFSTKSKAEQAADTEKHITESKNAIEKISLLHDMMTLIISNDEIARFKARKVEKYFQVVKIFTENEKTLSEEVTRFWTSVASADLLKQVPMP